MPHNRRPVPVPDGSETTYPMPFSFVLAGFAFPLIPSCFIVVFQEPNIMTEFVYFPFLEIVSIDAFMGLRLTLTGAIHKHIRMYVYVCVYVYTCVRATAFELGFLRTLRTCLIHTVIDILCGQAAH